MPDSQVDEIKQRLNIAEVIGEYIKLTPAGTNFKARCPFHNEKTPSFMVSTDKQIWHCFGCDKGGDIFTFVQEIEGVDFPEALGILAKKAGVKLVARNPLVASQKTKLLEIIKWAAAYYYKTLLDSPRADKARAYLKSRGVSEEMIDDFKLGYALMDWENLNNFLKKKGYAEEDIFLAGLTIKKERGVGFYDRFRGRLLFPIANVHGEIIGFSGRLIEQEEGKEMAKYINTPNTLVYNKSQVLFGLDKAKTAIKENKLAILVEGNMDVLSSYQAGVKNVVGSSGTALTAEQVGLLKRYSPNFAFCFDTDAAGQQATLRGLEEVFKQGVNIKIIELPFGKDPDECIKKDKDLWVKAAQEAKSVMEYYFSLAEKKFDFTQLEDKKEAAKLLLSLISKLTDSIEQTHYLQKLSGLIRVEENILRDSLNKIIRQKKYSSEGGTEGAKPFAPKNKEKNLMLSEMILGLGLKFSQELPHIINSLKAEAVHDSLHSLYKRLIIYYNQKHELNLEEFRSEAREADPDFGQKIDYLLLLAEKELAEEPDEKWLENERKEMVKSLNKEHITGQIKELSLKIKESEKMQDKASLVQLYQEFSQLTEELKNLRS
ncbi:MAG: DNA primase [Patescibacteria group bacterium]